MWIRKRRSARGRAARPAPARAEFRSAETQQAQSTGKEDETDEEATRRLRAQQLEKDTEDPGRRAGQHHEAEEALETRRHGIETEPPICTSAHTAAERTGFR